MNTINRRNIKLPFSKEQAKTAFVTMKVSRKRRNTNKLKGINIE